MPRLALTGGAYQARSVIASAQRCLNLHNEPLPQQQGEPAQYAHYPTPGLTLLGTMPQGPIRGIRQATTGGIYVVAGNGVYLVDPTAWTSTLLGSITALRPYPVSMQDNGVTMVVVDGTASGWTIDLSSHTFASITATATQTPVSAASTNSIVAGTARYTPFTPTTTMSVTTATVTLGTGYTGNLVCAIFSDTSGAPSTQVGSLAKIVNPVAGSNTLTFDVNNYPSVSGGSQYWIGFDSDTSSGTWSVASGHTGLSSSTAYSSFPHASPTTSAAAAVVCSLNMASDPGGLFAGADKVDFLDTYFLFNKPKTPQFYSSLSLSTSFDSLAQDFADKESYSDLLVTIAVARREIWLLGERTTEIWYDAGASTTADFQFQQIPGVFVDHGCAAKYSVAEYDNSIFWLTSDRTGQGFVLQGAGYQTKRLSTFAIEHAIATYSRIDDAVGMIYSLAGHTCYVLTFPEADHTWVYDITSGFWHEWCWLDSNGEEHRHRANCMYPINGKIVVGDWENGNLYMLDRNAYTDAGAPIKRQRSFPHAINDARRVFYREFLADIETGNDLPEVNVTTSIVETPNWPPEIARLLGVSNMLATVAVVDWVRGYVYYTDLNVYQKYAVNLATQTAPIASATAPGDNPAFLALDPLSGDLLLQRGVTNGEPILKLDPTTFAVIGSFGATTSFPSYPTAVWVGQSLVCVVCNGVSWGFLKYSEFSGAVAAIRVDNMTQAGFGQNVVSGSTDNRGSICAGVSGGSTASVFLSYDSTTVPTPSIPLYVITVTAGAETYNPASWPATNPHITWTTAGSVLAGAVDPTQAGITVYSLGCDQADGNAIMWVGTGAVSHSPVNWWIIKVRATDAAVLWTVSITDNVSDSVRVQLDTSRINGSLWLFDGNMSIQIDTILGTAVTRRFRGTFNNIPGYPIIDSETQLAFYQGSYNGGITDSPVPADSGTTNFSSGWAIMGGQTATTVTTPVSLADIRIFLDWSDDRGHSYKIPVGQNIGRPGAYLTSLQWQRLGYARDRVFRLTWSAPVSTALQGAFIDLDAAPKT